MTLDGPTCDERFYLDSSWKSQAASPAPSSSGSVASSEVTAEMDHTWRRTSSASDSTVPQSYEENSGSNMWTASNLQQQNNSSGPFSHSPHAYSNMNSYPSPTSDGMSFIYICDMCIVKILLLVKLICYSISGHQPIKIWWYYYVCCWWQKTFFSHILYIWYF